MLDVCRLFSDRPVGASTSAMVYSLTETSKLNRVNPYHYLQYVLEKVSAIPDPGRMSAFELDGLMPWNAMLQEAIRSYRKTKDD
ncbi:MAG: transposase domain-containing protein [Sarcina sp.]|nr:transposase domain-containing protein [Sarcina sp.]